MPHDLRPTVLLVDDNAQIRSFIKPALEDNGFNCIEAADGEEGVRKAIELRPDLILLDVHVHRVRGSVGTFERRWAFMFLEVTTEKRVRAHLENMASFKTLIVMKAMLAGRSANRRIRYGYHCVPNGTYTRMLKP